MTDIGMFDKLAGAGNKVKPQNKQVGGSHYMYFDIQPYELSLIHI